MMRWRRKSAPEPRSWGSRSGRARILLEDEDAASQWAFREVLTEAGFDVATCDGPNRLPNHRCPLIADGDCPLVSGADVIVNALHLTDEANRAVLGAVRTAQPDTPIIVETTRLRARHFQDLVAGCRLLLEPVGQQDLLTEVDAALAP